MNSIGYTHLLAFLLHSVSAILAFLSQPDSGLELGKLVVHKVILLLLLLQAKKLLLLPCHNRIMLSLTRLTW